MLAARLSVIVLLGCMAVGCGWWSPSPANRARHFIESQVAADTPAAALGGDLAGRVALDYARALARQGVGLQYRVEASADVPGQASAVVAILPERADGAISPLRFRVQLTRDDTGDLHVATWSAMP
ncbi:MAG: hypothetical protein ACLGHO_03080 [Gammaproteobacteria bacterium]